MYTPACPYPFSEPKIAWEYAFWNFQAPKALKCVLPPAPPPSQFWFFQAPKTLKCVLPPAPPHPLRAQDMPGSTHTKIRTPACPPPPFSEPKIAWVCPPPRLRAQDCLGDAFWNFQAPNTKMCTPACRPALSWQHAFCDFQGPKTPKCALPPRLPGSTHVYMLLVFFCRSSLFCSHIQMLSGSQ